MKHKRLKIVLWISLCLGAIFILGIINAFNGNLISRSIADKAIRAYVEETYPEMDLEVGKTSYNFKFSEYGARVQSTTSEDTHFYVSYTNSRGISDSYEGDVEECWNTFLRLDQEFSHIVEPIIEEKLPYEFDMVIAGLDKEGLYNTGVLTLDMPLDLDHIPLDTYVTIYVYSENMSWDHVAEVSLELDALMVQNNLQIDEYSVILETPKQEERKSYEYLGIYDFPRELLGEKNLPQVMKSHYEKWEEEGSKLKAQEISSEDL